MVRTMGQGFGEEVGLRPEGGLCCGLTVRMVIPCGGGGTRAQAQVAHVSPDGAKPWGPES